MSDRHAPARSMGGPLPRARVAGAGAGTGTSAQANGTSSGRQRLFQGHFTRRPTARSAAPPDTATPGGALADSSLRLDGEGGGGSGRDHSSSEIVVRDETGEVVVDDLPPLMEDDPDEPPALDEQQERERERHRLAEAVKQYRMDQGMLPAHAEGMN